MDAMERQQGLTAFLRSRGIAFRGSDKIFLAPDIPMKKVSGAATSVSRWARPDEIAVLVDDTVFGGAKEGVFFTDTWMILKPLMLDPTPFQLAKINHLAVEGRTLYINYSEAISLTLANKRELALLVDGVGAYIQTLKTPTPSNRPPPPMSTAASSTAHASAHTGGARSSTWFEQHMAELASERLWGGDLAYRQLLLEVLRLSSSLPQFCRDQRISLTDGQWVMVHGDAMRLEVYFYLFTVMQTLLTSTCGFTDEDAQDFLVGMIVPVMIPYVQNIEAILVKRSLRAVANPASLLKDSVLLGEFKERTNYYRDTIDNDIRNMPMAFMACLSCPSVLKLLSDPDEFNAIAGETRELIRRVIRRPAIFEFMRNISAGAEVAMTCFFETVNS